MIQKFDFRSIEWVLWPKVDVHFEGQLGEDGVFGAIDGSNPAK